MARVRISEFQAKKILTKELNLPWQGLQVDSRITAATIEAFFGPVELVAKVDQGIKKRAKQGLVSIRNTPGVLRSFVKAKSQQKFSQFLIEPFVPHTANQEQYLSLERVRDGIKVLYSPHGGVEIEDHWQQVNSTISDPIVKKLVAKLKTIFDKYYFSFLEINPLVVKDEQIYLLDLAVEIDDAALNIPVVSNLQIEPISPIKLSSSEEQIAKLDKSSPASLKYRLLNPNGSVWMLLSGGGASLVLADEVADFGFGQELANYGEYSGNPTMQDTYLYTRVILTDLLKSKSHQKVLVIAGGVANFTDVAKTFQGVIKALEENKQALKKQDVLVFVRRGGPNQKQGLALMARFLKDSGLYGTVLDSSAVLTEVIKLAVKILRKEQ
ncbi:hypothetical protein A2313_02675 [Candidatus Roizmanbacteria bacterium RIFOXYB2_FULL_41_10]|nr:MAG: hypothetical protein A2377_02375 [Candidatus Roizmanbacteria bacterium RIFOXYB1_FULL_41_27]OGK69048.1 MAG: hypothetical protein A2262_00755 [Candidatus Roizmanbacteria bacterium RIFOXYA2_FULL_41_8]OGK70642.1 MAG: hypothetical protein A2313_02675 [Candidatus Roizmanbacteria bacterium RIFOXYB2_FULL_41_10]OGK70896.1 MAG: hypothetical protein A2403_02335 [Candidatus Roizmanbacteria bacterium RIFOXYC1_FULL_41_16]OGK75525.1 MAG: hypothetical protein A2575_02370 [Candidatus Roizmanbacteria bac